MKPDRNQQPMGEGAHREEIKRVLERALKEEEKMVKIMEGRRDDPRTIQWALEKALEMVALDMPFAEIELASRIARWMKKLLEEDFEEEKEFEVIDERVDALTKFEGKVPLNYYGEIAEARLTVNVKGHVFSLYFYVYVARGEPGAGTNFLMGLRPVAVDYEGKAQQ